MNRYLYIFITVALSLLGFTSKAQTAESLFWLSDSLQVNEVASDVADLTEALGHKGPAVENSHMALRMYFDDSGAIDVYSKTGRGMELLSYLWNPTEGQQDTLAVGCDAYEVGKTLGLGGVALWDGEKIVPVAATNGRTARVGSTKKGSFAELISYGVAYGDDMVNISVRIDMNVKSREAQVTVQELSGKKVRFVTGVNWHQGQKVTNGDGYISVWGPHPSTDGRKPFAVGGGLIYSVKAFPSAEKTDDMVRIISVPTDGFKTTIISSSTKEAELNNAKRFEAYMTK